MNHAELGVPTHSLSGKKIPFALGLVAPCFSTVMIVASIPMVQLLTMAEFFYFSSRLKVLWGDKGGAPAIDL